MPFSVALVVGAGDFPARCAAHRAFLAAAILARPAALILLFFLAGLAVGAFATGKGYSAVVSDGEIFTLPQIFELGKQW